MIFNLLPTVLLLGLGVFATDSGENEGSESNTFIAPKPGNWADGAVQKFKQGTKLEVKFNTTIPDPQLLLYCSYIQNPIISVKIDPPSARDYKFQLDFAAQPNCYLQLQPKANSTASIKPFTTGIFAIEEDPNWDGDVNDMFDSNQCPVCNCMANASASGKAEVFGIGASSSISLSVGGKRRRKD